MSADAVQRFTLSKGIILNVLRPARRLSTRAAVCEQTTRSLRSEPFWAALSCLLTKNRAFGRIGSAYNKLDDLENAIKFYSKSLTEHRTPDILTKLRLAEKAKTEADRTAYIDPQKAEAAREEGNTAFKVRA